MKLKIKNFQSIKNAELEFPVGITMICGSTNSGKTSILRSFYSALCNPTNAKFDINHNTDEESCEVSIVDEEACIEWIRTKNTVNYIVNGEKYYKCGKSNIWSILPEYSIKCEKEHSIYNFHMEYDYLFPFRYSNSEVFNIFERVIALDDTTSVSKAINSDITSLSLLRKQVKKSIEDIEREKEEKEVCFVSLLREMDEFLSSCTLNGDSSKCNELNECNELTKLNQCNEIINNQSNEINDVNELLRSKIKELNEYLLKEINKLRSIDNTLKSLKDNKETILKLSLEEDKLNNSLKTFNNKEVFSKIGIFFQSIFDDIVSYNAIKSVYRGIQESSKRIGKLIPIVGVDVNLSLESEDKNIYMYSKYADVSNEVNIIVGKIKRIGRLSDVDVEKSNLNFTDTQEYLAFLNLRKVMKKLDVLSSELPTVEECSYRFDFDKNLYYSYINNMKTIKDLCTEVTCLDSNILSSQGDLDKVSSELAEFKCCPLCGALR